MNDATETRIPAHTALLFGDLASDGRVYDPRTDLVGTIVFLGSELADVRWDVRDRDGVGGYVTTVRLDAIEALVSS